MLRLFSFFSTSSSESCASKAVNTPTLTSSLLLAGCIRALRPAFQLMSAIRISRERGSGYKMARMKAHVALGRRGFLGSAGGGGGARLWADETLDAAVQNVNRSSSPSGLKITD